MIKTNNLSDQIQKQLPFELVNFMKLAGDTAGRLGQKLYLVGGVVRDLILERPNLDLDLVAERNAITLADELARIKNGKVVAHSRFNTAKIRWDRWSVDIATTRAEVYERPGALPTVQCGGDIESDLIRRDFTINAMAVDLDPQHFGEVIDLFHGREDLEQGFIRILHDNSFKDDATRIWRAVRYEQRLDFHIEPHTLELLKQDLTYLDTLSGDRVRHELELCLEEGHPEKSLLRAGQLGVLGRICPSLKADEWTAKKIARARGLMQPYCPPEELYLAFLVYRISPAELEDLVTYLKFSNRLARILRDTLDLKYHLPELALPGMLPSRIYRLLHHYHPTAILANLLATESSLMRERIDSYLNKLRLIQPALTGEDLKAMGLGSGPRIREILETLLESRLDGNLVSREDEVQFVAKMVKAVK